MSYTVLARKYRSRTFDEVVGQAAVTRTLKNAITGDRVHHGYLFCGTRGVGKTSMARILAKALNCLKSKGPTTEPCGECDSCRAIAEGEDIDVVEIDAASNTGVDNIRELRSNSILRPARARYKIYIIDEVHMLSTAAFNALLKTLEEPPSHIKFILATTDPQKVPATIQSRVQRFEFKPIGIDEIGEQLARLCKLEKVKAEPAAIKRVARLAAGSMRDALSLLDQLLSLCGQDLTAERVDEILPASHDELLADLIDQLAAGDAAGTLNAADQSLARGVTPDQWCGGLISQLRDLMLLRVCGPDTELVDVPAGLRERLVEQSRKFDAGTYVHMIAVLEELRRTVRYSGAGRALIEAALVRLAEAPKYTALETLLSRLDGAAAPPPPPVAPGTASSVSRPAGGSMTSTTAARTAPPAAPADKKKVTGGPAGAEARAAASPARPQSPPPRTRREDLEAAYAEPAIQQAMKIFDGKLVSVQRKTPSGGAPDAAAAEE